MEDSKINDLPPVYKAFLNHLSHPKGQGNAYFVLNWSILVILLPFLVYFITFIDRRFIDWILLFYSIVLVGLYITLIQSFKRSMSFVSNPFDFVKVQLINFVMVTVSFGLSHFYLWKLYNQAYNGTISSLFDTIYFSFITVATVGYGDISPVWVCSKLLTILEVFFGLWFVVTVVPVAVADQAERIRHFRDSRQKVFEELQTAIKNGELKKVFSRDKKSLDKQEDE